MKKVYICSDHVIGIFSGIYDAWKEGRREEDAGIALKDQLEQQLFCEYTEVEEADRKAIVVERLIKNHLGYEAYWNIYHALLSECSDKADAVFGTMLAAKTIPNSKKIMEYLSHPKVVKVFELSKTVANEAHMFMEFIRFRELENRVLFSEITPKNQVLTCIADHFTNRFPLENWMIYDKTHEMFLVHRARCQWILVLGEEINREAIGRVSRAELQYEALWKDFCRTISIEERESLKLQKGNLPLRYRQDMTEFSSSI